MTKVTSLSLIRWAQTIQVAKTFDPFFVAYLVARGFPMHQILQLLPLQVLLSFPLSIPTGIFADRRSRKLSMAIGAGACTVSMLLYGLAPSLAGVICASLLASTGKNFFSGADGAMARQAHQSHHGTEWSSIYRKYVNTLDRWRGISEAAGCVVATILASTVGLTAVVWTQGLVYLSLFALTLFMAEPEKPDPLLAKLQVDDRYIRATAILSQVHPGIANAYSLLVLDPDWQPDQKIGDALEHLGLVAKLTDGRYKVTDPAKSGITLYPPPPDPTKERNRYVFYVVQLPPRSFPAVVLAVSAKQSPYAGSLRVLEPESFAKKWPTIRPNSGFGGAFVRTKGPARELTLDEHTEVLASVNRREIKRRRWSLVALLAAAGAVASFTAVTYRLAQVYYEQVRFEGHALPPSGFGWIWAAYLASLWTFGLGYKFTGRLGYRQALAALGVLTLVGAGCYAVFGLTTSIWGLLAILGLALVRSQESSLLTLFFNKLTSAERQAATLSTVKTIQDGLAAAILVGASLAQSTIGLTGAFIIVGAIHAVLIILALTVLGILYRVLPGSTPALAKGPAWATIAIIWPVRFSHLSSRCSAIRVRRSQKTTLNQ
jgi:hypothetical protein